MTVIWRQWIDGFDAETEEIGCTATVDSGASGRDKNRLTSEIASATDTGDRATADLTTAAFLPGGSEGRIRFKFKPLAFPVGDPWNPLNNVTILHVANIDPVQIVELFAADDQEIGGFSQANTLRSTSVVSIGGTIVTVADTEYTIEVAWRGATDATGFRRIWLDETLVYEHTSLDMVAANDCDVGAIYFGFHHYDGADAEGLRCEIRWAQVTDDAEETLVDPTDAAQATILRPAMVM